MSNDANSNGRTETMPDINLTKPSHQTRKLLSRRHKTLIVIVVVALIVGVSAYSFRTKSPKIAPYNAAVILVLKGGKITDAQKILDNAINDTSDKQAKANYYLQKASFELSNNLVNDAMISARSAESLYPSSMSANTIAEIAKFERDKPLAIQWYKTTITRLDKTTQGYQLTLQELQANINDLSQ